MSKSDYPDEVQKYLTAIYESLTEDKFFEDYEIEKYGETTLYEVAGPILLDKWLKGSLDEFSEEDLTNILTRTITYAIIYEMKEHGVVDTIEDENGETLLFITKKGEEKGLNFLKH